MNQYKTFYGLSNEVKEIWWMMNQWYFKFEIQSAKVNASSQKIAYLLNKSMKMKLFQDLEGAPGFKGEPLKGLGASSFRPSRN